MDSQADTKPAGRRDIGYGRIAVIGVIIISLIGVAWLFVQLTGVMMLIFAAIVLAMVFDAMARRITSLTLLPRGLALTVAVLLLLAVLFGIFALFGAQLVDQFDTIAEQLPRAFTAIQVQLDAWGLGDRVRALLDQGAGDVNSIMRGAGGYVLSAGSGLADVVLVLVGAIFLASDPAVYRRGVVLLMPKRAERVTGEALDDATRALRGWMMGQGLSMVVVAALTWAGLALLGVPAAGGLALIAGLLDVIPFIGPIIAGVPAVILAFTVSPATALWTVGLFLFVQQLQGNFLQPMIQKYAVDVPPAVLLFAVIGAGVLFGFLGVLLAGPLTVVVYVLVQRVYVRTLLDKPIAIAGSEDKS